MTLSVAKKANASAGDNRACSDGRDRENECSSHEGTGAGSRGFSKMGPLCYGHRSWEKLLHLWGFWAHGPSLQEPGTERESSR